MKMIVSYQFKIFGRVDFYKFCCCCCWFVLLLSLICRHFYEEYFARKCCYRVVNGSLEHLFFFLFVRLLEVSEDRFAVIFFHVFIFICKYVAYFLPHKWNSPIPSLGTMQPGCVAFTYFGQECQSLCDEVSISVEISFLLEMTVAGTLSNQQTNKQSRWHQSIWESRYVLSSVSQESLENCTMNQCWFV